MTGGFPFFALYTAEARLKAFRALSHSEVLGVSIKGK